MLQRQPQYAMPTAALEVGCALSERVDVSPGRACREKQPGPAQLGVSPCRPSVQNVVGSRNRLRYAIIDNVSGILRPGRLTLLLGPPGSGKSVLLRTLAGRMRKLNNVQVLKPRNAAGKAGCCVRVHIFQECRECCFPTVNHV